MSELKPKDHAEAVALFRSEIIGALTRRELDRGELREELTRLAKRRYRAPGAKSTRQYAASTLERWLYRYKKGGLEALRPEPRSDRGRARELTQEQRELLLDVRREHRAASVPLIMRTLVAEGRLDPGAVSEATIRRLYVDHGLDRVAAASPLPVAPSLGVTRDGWSAVRVERLCGFARGARHPHSARQGAAGGGMEPSVPT